MPSCEAIKSTYQKIRTGSPPRRFISRMVFWAEALYLRDNTDPVLRATFLSMIKAQDPLGEMRNDVFDLARRKKKEAFIDPRGLPGSYFVQEDAGSAKKSKDNECIFCSHKDLSEVHSFFPE